MRIEHLTPQLIGSFDAACDMAHKNGHETIGTEDWLLAFLYDPSYSLRMSLDEHQRVANFVGDKYPNYGAFEKYKELRQSDELFGAVNQAIFQRPGGAGKRVTRDDVLWVLLGNENTAVCALRAAGVDVQTLRVSLLAGIKSGVGRE